MTKQALTANRVLDGLVIFLDKDGSWTLDIDKALVVDTDEQAQELERKALSAADDDLVMDIYLFDVELVDGRVRAAHIRERIRTLGPSVRLDLGKQADGLGGGFQAV